MNETYIEIPSYDKDIKVHGMLRGDFTMPLIILAPGLGGWMHDLQMFNASRYFDTKGYATLRLSFYGHDDSQRNISDFGVHDNANDIDAAVDYALSKKVPFVAVAGHSFSGLAIVYSKKQKFNTGILWDPTHTDGYNDPDAQSNLDRDFMYINEIKSYVSGIGPGYVLSDKVFNEHQPGSNQAAKIFNKPLLVINASDTQSQIDRGKDYVDSCPSKSRQVVVPDSSHPFTENGAMEKLFEETLKWVEEINNCS